MQAQVQVQAKAPSKVMQFQRNKFIVFVEDSHDGRSAVSHLIN